MAKHRPQPVRRRHKIEDAIDRLNEAHYHIHMMEARYHDADPFRFSFNSFLRVLKEIPQILRMAMQAEPGFTAWFQGRFATAAQDPLVRELFKQRRARPSTNVVASFESG